MLQQRARQPTPLRGRLPATERHYSEKSTRLTVGARPKSDPTRRSIRRASYEKAAGTTSTPTAFGKSSHPAKCHRPAAIGLTKKCCASLVVSRQTIAISGHARRRAAPGRPGCRSGPLSILICINAELLGIRLVVICLERERYELRVGNPPAQRENSFNWQITLDDLFACHNVDDRRRDHNECFRVSIGSDRLYCFRCYLLHRRRFGN